MTQFIRIAVFALTASLAAASVQARPVNMARLSEACQATILESGIDPATLERRDVKVADDGTCTLVQVEAEAEAVEPEVVVPEAVVPEVVEPEVVEPEVVVPEVVEPEVVEPEVMEPEVAEPVVVKPEVVEPEVVEPEVVAPEVVEPQVSEPEATEPDAVMPEPFEPEVVVPEVVEGGQQDAGSALPADAAVIGDAGAAAEIEDDPDAVSDAAVEVVTETVTAEETRSSDEEFAAPKKKPAASDDSERNRDIARILGALAAGVVIGSLLDDNSQVVGDTGDRLIVERDGQYHVLKDENLLLRQPGSDLRTEAFTDGSTRTVVTRQDGIRVVTIRDGNGALVRRTRFLPDGREYVLFDETIYRNQSVAIANLPPSRGGGLYRDYGLAGNDELVAALRDETGLMSGRAWSLRQIRENEALRAMMPRIDLDVITFDSGSSALAPDLALSLARLGRVMVQMIDDDPAELFLIEGHTDAVGSEIANLTLSDRRAETVALALTEYFGIPPESMVVQGYGEAFPKVPVLGDERANRRAAVRRITPLLGDY